MSEEVKTTPTRIDDVQPGMELQGKVKRIEIYGAFVDVGVGVDGLLHISQLGRPNVKNVEDVVKAGDQITVYVLKVEPENRRIALSLERPPAMSWDNLSEGSTVTGTVVRLEKFGVFVEIGAERPGMIHVSELANGYVNSPSDVVQVGQEVTAQIIKINRKKKRIDLSLKALERPAETSRPEPAASEEDERVPTAMELALRRAMKDVPEDDFPAYREREGSGKKRDKRERRERRERRDDYEDIYERTLRHR
jgi:small subunit ribosomal protein S1